MTVAVTRDPFGSSTSRVVAQYNAGQIVEVLETRRIGDRIRGRTNAGWIWYTLEDGTVQLDELSAEEMHALRAEQLLRKAVCKLQHAKSEAAFAAWQAHALSSRQMRYIARRVICRMQRGLLAGAWQAWREFTGWSVRSKVLMANIDKTVTAACQGTAQLVRMGYECQRPQTPRAQSVATHAACGLVNSIRYMVHDGQICSPECSGAARCSALPEQVTAGRVFPVASHWEM